MTEPVLRISPKKYAGETTIVSMRMAKGLLKDIDNIRYIVFVPEILLLFLGFFHLILHKRWTKKQDTELKTEFYKIFSFNHQ